MPATYEPIASTTLGTAAADITFSSIPGTYTDLVLVLYGGFATAASDLYTQFNSDTGTNYSNSDLRGNGTAAAANRNDPMAMATRFHFWFTAARCDRPRRLTSPITRAAD